MSKKKDDSNFGNLNKKTVNRVLIGIGAGAALLFAYLFFTGAFSSAKVFADPAAPAQIEGDVKQAAINYNAMTYKLISADEDVCVAPVLVASNIGLYGEGALDEGKEQAAEILSSDSGTKENHAALVNSLNKPFEQSSFTGLFMDKRTSPKSTFIDANNYYGTRFETVDFFDFVKARDRINEIAAEKTGGSITKVTETLNLNSSMVFVSGYKFKEYLSAEAGSVSIVKGTFVGGETDFYNLEGAKVKLFENERATFLRIPLENGFEYEVLMPKDGDFKKITAADIKSYRDGAKETVASVFVPAPKFSGINELKPMLKSAGFDAPFNKDTLIGNITKSTKSKIDKVDQAIDFEILIKNGGQSAGSATQKIAIDKPFVFMVSDGATGCKVIAGKRSK